MTDLDLVPTEDLLQGAQAALRPHGLRRPWTTTVETGPRASASAAPTTPSQHSGLAALIQHAIMDAAQDDD